MKKELNRRKKRKKYSGLSKEQMRALRRKKRQQIVVAQALLLILLVGGGLFGGGFYIVWNLPSIKLERELDAASKYEKSQEYAAALASYEEALSIDSTSVKAYQNMAGAYMDMEDAPKAKQILFEGWENTHDKELLDYYLTLILNEGVGDINSGNVTLSTAEKFVSVLEIESGNEDALSLLGTAYEWLNPVIAEEGMTYFTEQTFEEYVQFMDRLFTLANQSGSVEIGKRYADYALFDMSQMKMNRPYIAPYLTILERASAFAGEEKKGSIDELIACLQKEAQVQEMFADIFAQFDAGNYEAAKEFIVTDAYQSLRDEFVNQTVEYWSGASFIPLCREVVWINRTEEGVTFEYPSYKDNETTAGMITIYANPLTDEGVPRSRIAYEPAKTGESDYPHTEFIISYMLSNVQKSNSFTLEMNYHLETRVTTETGVDTEMIGDWGGPYEWKKTY